MAGSSVIPMMNTKAKARTMEAAKEAKKKLPVTEIAKKCGVTRQAVYGWLKGVDAITDGPALVELSEISGLNPLWIVKGRGPKGGLSEDEKLILRAFSLFGQESKDLWITAAKNRIEQDDATRKRA